jgi:hypothetical protein
MHALASMMEPSAWRQLSDLRTAPAYGEEYTATSFPKPQFSLNY